MIGIKIAKLFTAPAVYMYCAENSENVLDSIDTDALLLHGLLKVNVIEAKDLPDTDNAFFNISRGDLTDPYVEVKIANCSLLKTSVKKNCLNPVWNEEFSIPVCHYCSNLEVKVKDREHVGGETVGRIWISAEQLLSEKPVTDWFDLQVKRFHE